MSAVSAESPRGSADLLNSSANATQAAANPPANGGSARADFGPNQWLVDELYQRYLADPGSVDQAWWSFFADYQAQPETATSQSAAAGQAGSAVPAPPPATSQRRPGQPHRLRRPPEPGRRPPPVARLRQPTTSHEVDQAPRRHRAPLPFLRVRLVQVALRQPRPAALGLRAQAPRVQAPRVQTPRVQAPRPRVPQAPRREGGPERQLPPPAQPAPVPS